MGKRNLYLKNTPLEEALSIYTDAFKSILKMQYEELPVEKSLGRILKEAVYAGCSSPLFNAAAMDGIAVISTDTKGASERTPLTLKKNKDFIVVDTGDPINFPYDAVIMAEDVIEIDDDTVQIIEAATGWQHIRPIGEDIVTGEMLLPSLHKIRPIDIGVLFSGGIIKINVVKRPEIGIFPTGTEIIEPTQTPKDGDIIESNSRMFEAMVTSYGGTAYRFPPIEDDYNKIKTAIEEAVNKFDMVIVNAGSSAGTEDFTVHILRELGEVLIHGVAIKPGKPVILAIVKGKPVIGLPGYPVSAYIDFENFVKPVMSLMTGEPTSDNNVVDAVISKRMISSLKHKEYVRVKVGQVGDKLVASPLARGAGAAMSLVRADGFCVIEQNCEGVEAGEIVKVELYRSLQEIRHTIVAIGSHDLILDLISDLMSSNYPGNYLSSTHIGSMGGLMALKRGEAHIAPTHLLDEATGIYNMPYIKKMFEEPMALIKGVKRIQGLIVQKGNPLNLKDISDLKKCRYVNRQRGAGTRVLFDYKLKQAGIDSLEIPGYDRESATHMAVAALVSSGSADAGMGIFAAAKAMQLDFIEIGQEEYDFAIPVKHLKLPEVITFINILKSDEFHVCLDKFGGYEYSQSGKLCYMDEEII
ncbi:molybdopterin biosynthesis protein [[Clostridium] fimetarium]|uniref:Molybdopterin molybdenumtransferase n=1 Tax=[Clostridium] fimetarium TaxID=99656 RepID=A0A1I0RF16_9FIRM|nr:molybdopterin biosynthesis protein [[Clostridium] fimetarium]SEW39437.1 putative molybdopterin biosynthesis protein [[Clostridium] fimetarium]